MLLDSNMVGKSNNTRKFKQPQWKQQGQAASQITCNDLDLLCLAALSNYPIARYVKTTIKPKRHQRQSPQHCCFEEEK